MGLPSKGTIVLIRFPFSDLSKSKLRPALVIAATDKKMILSYAKLQAKIMVI
jgi:hypothetical protein